METLVTLNGGQVVVSSERIAEGVGKEHKPVIRLVRDNQTDLEEFGRVRFENAPFETAGGEQSREVALLSEPQATLLLTYMRNNEVVRAFKKRLVKAFFEMREKLMAEEKARLAVEAKARAAIGGHEDEEDEEEAAIFGRALGDKESDTAMWEKSLQEVFGGEPTSKQLDRFAHFLLFWNRYPVKKRKAELMAPAFAAWCALDVMNKLPLTDDLLKRLCLQARSDAWKEEDGRYIPQPQNWLIYGYYSKSVRGEPRRLRKRDDEYIATAATFLNERFLEKKAAQSKAKACPCRIVNVNAQ